MLSYCVHLFRPVTRLTPLCMSPWLISWHCAVYCGCRVTTGCGYTVTHIGHWHQDHPDTSQRGVAHTADQPHCRTPGKLGINKVMQCWTQTGQGMQHVLQHQQQARSGPRHQKFWSMINNFTT